MVEVRAWADNNVDTGEFEELTFTIVDPCVISTLIIDEDNRVFKVIPEITAEQ